MTNQNEIIKKAVNYVTCKYDTKGNSIFWNIGGTINVTQFYRYLLSQPGFSGFKTVLEFENYLKLNVRTLGLIGKIAIKSGSRNYADKFAAAEAVIDSFKDSVVAFDNAKDNDVVFRTKLGNGNVVLYNHEVISKHEMNMLKVAYKTTEGIKYFDVRPCLFKNWSKWDDERKQASYKDDLKFIF